MLQLKVIEELVLGYLESLKTCQRFRSSGMNSHNIFSAQHYAMDLCLSVTSRCSTKTAWCSTFTVPHNSRGTLVRMGKHTRLPWEITFPIGVLWASSDTRFLAVGWTIFAQSTGVPNTQTDHVVCRLCWRPPSVYHLCRYGPVIKHTWNYKW